LERTADVMGMTYSKAGVDRGEEEAAVAALVEEVRSTHSLRKGKVGESLLGIGHFSGLVKLDEERVLAISTDGVGSKIRVAEALGRYDTIGIDLIAMNANDLLCVGAEPLTLVDYLAMEKADRRIAREVGKGLAKGAEEAKISISGGEVAILPEGVKGIDLAGTIVGIVHRDEIVLGEEIVPGDVVLGLASTGIHSNGLTLARKVLLDAYPIDEEVFGERSVGEELLVPTKIYVREVRGLMEEEGVKVKGMANITGGGLGNLDRTTPYGFLLEDLPEAPPVFQEIQRLGDVSEEEMYRTFNMGVGFCIVLEEADVDRAAKLLQRHRTRYFEIGRVVEEKGVRIRGKDFVLGYG
jgi:phosphoribosylformylglycinamidine cyclo-ligase